MGGRVFVETYCVADGVWELNTDSVDLLAAARVSFPAGVAAPGLSPGLRLYVTLNEAGGTGTWPQPVCRGRDHLAFCCFGDESAILFDYRKRVATGSVTRAVAENSRYWRECVFPFALGVMSPVLGSVPLHAACVRYRGQGVLIGARSGAGKSTLAATLARRGIEFISDDWVYLTARDGLRVHALPVPLKLLPDATRYFPGLQSRPSTQSQNGEWSIAFDPAEIFGSPRGYHCQPEVVILFDRIPGGSLRVHEAQGRDLLEWFSEPLDCVPACLEVQRQEQLALIRALRSCRCYVVTCDGTPDEIADILLDVCDGTLSASQQHPDEPTPGIEHLDLLRRGVPAPYRRIVDIGGIGAAISTNCAEVLQQFPAASSRTTDFAMTVIVETGPWPGSTASSFHYSDSVGYITLGDEGFIAFDAEEREVAAFVSETAIRTGRVGHELRRLCSKFACASAAGK